MDRYVTDAIWSQFVSSIDMLENAIRACPEDAWSIEQRSPQFWYLVFHTLFWLDRYLSESDEDFEPPPPFTLEEMKPDGMLPEQPYTKEQLLSYLEHGRNKARRALANLTNDRAVRLQRYGWGEVSFLEVLIYNLRHIQHGVGQLNLLLRQSTDSAPSWVARAGSASL